MASNLYANKTSLFSFCGKNALESYSLEGPKRSTAGRFLRPGSSWRSTGRVFQVGLRDLCAALFMPHLGVEPWCKAMRSMLSLSDPVSTCGRPVGVMDYIADTHTG